MYQRQMVSTMNHDVKKHDPCELEQLRKELRMEGILEVRSQDGVLTCGPDQSSGDLHSLITQLEKSSMWSEWSGFVLAQVAKVLIATVRYRLAQDLGYEQVLSEVGMRQAMEETSQESVRAAESKWRQCKRDGGNKGRKKSQPAISDR